MNKSWVIGFWVEVIYLLHTYLIFGKIKHRSVKSVTEISCSNLPYYNIFAYYHAKLPTLTALERHDSEHHLQYSL